MEISQSIEKLHRQLPLRARRDALSPALAAMHRAILRSFIDRGRPPTLVELAPASPDGDVGSALRRLSDDDLVVLDRDGRELAGAYPMSAARTPHCIRAAGHNFYAMCALDALSIAPMYDLQVHIGSRCRMTGEPISIVQHAMTLISVKPSREVRVGVRWQNPQGAAAHSMCLEMIFLRDAATAAQWHHVDPANLSVFTLDAAVAIGAGFFEGLA